MSSEKSLPLCRLRVGVFSGGRSSERAVSLRSGQAVRTALKNCGFSVLAIDPRNPARTRRLLSRIDLAFLALHGKGGEDGTIQRRLERAKIPYVGSDARGSCLAFDKNRAKRLFRRFHIPTPRWKIFNRRDWKKLERFPAPFFVKPVADGSSIGVFLVEDFSESAEKILLALKHYPMLIAEEKITGREFTVGILGKRALPVIELRPKRDFYDYKAKYTAGLTDYLVPAPIPSRWCQRFQQVALRVHQSLGLRDFSRVDLMANEWGEPFVLEANTIPGFTALSLLPKAAREAGISFEELCLQLVKMAWRRTHGKT